MVGSFYLPLVLLAAVVGTGFSYFAWRNREQPGAAAVTVFLLGASLWAIAEGLTVSLGDADSMAFWTAVSLSVSVILPAAWLVFVLEYTGTRRRVSRRTVGVLLLEPFVFVLLVWSNNSHETVWSDSSIISAGSEFNVLTLEYGVAFWGHQGYSFLLLAVGMALLVRLLLFADRRVRFQTTLLLVAISLPAVLSSLYIFSVLPAGLDPTGVAYILAGVIIVTAVLEPELARIAPVTRDAGREAVFSELEDVIVILTGDNRVIDANPAAQRLLDCDENAFGHRLERIQPALAEQLSTREGTEAIAFETDGKRRYYDVRLSGLTGAYGVVSGKVLSLRDVTERRQREQRIEVMNRLIRHNIRNDLNVVRGKMELTKLNVSGGDEENLDDAIESVDGIVERSDKVGRLSRLLEQDEGGTIDIARELRGEFTQESRHRPDGTLDIALPEELRVAGGPSLVAAFDELVTNALVHNDSDSPQVKLSVDETGTDSSTASIAVADNGPGIDEQEIQTLVEGTETPLRHSSGVGLWLVQWLVGRVGGTLSFENADEGCTVTVRLPRPTSENPN